MAPLTVTIMESNNITNSHLHPMQDHSSTSPPSTHPYHHDLYEDQQQLYVHRCPFAHCHQHPVPHSDHHQHHKINRSPSIPVASRCADQNRRKSPSSSPPPPAGGGCSSSPLLGGWSESLTARGVNEPWVTEGYRNRVITYIVEQLSSKEVMQTRHARERLHRTVAALEQTVHNTTTYQKEYLKALAMKLSTVYQHLKKESNYTNSENLFLCDNPILKSTIEEDTTSLPNYKSAPNTHSSRPDTDHSANNVTTSHHLLLNDNKNSTSDSSPRESLTQHNLRTDQQYKTLNIIETNERISDTSPCNEDL